MTTPHLEEATFAAGCFWGVEHVFSQVAGVSETNVGYTGGTEAHPTYEMVCSGLTRHAEAVQIRFDPGVVPYDDILTVFFALHDPTTVDRQGNDVGPQYRSAIFYHSLEQKVAAETAIETLQPRLGRPIVTEVVPAGPFYTAEKYHQDYLVKNPTGYCHIPFDIWEILSALGIHRKEGAASSTL